MSHPSLTISLFGPLRVDVAGQPWPRVRTRSIEWILALLVLRQPRVLNRSWLAGTLWPDSRESQALKNLRNDLVALRKALGPEAARLQSPTRDTLTFDLAGADVDVVRFDQAIRAGDTAALRRAIQVYTGPLLEDCYEEWVLAERQQRAEQCLAALETVAREARERGHWEEAIRTLRQAEALDPLRESIVRDLMTCLAEAGEPVAAGEVYRRFRDHLQAELATAPDARTAQLFQQIRARARETARLPARTTLPVPSDSPAPGHARARPPQPLAPLIGRDQEVQALRVRLQHSRLVTLVGTGGVGKTRLAMEVAARAEAEDEGGTLWVELAPLADGALLLPSLAAAMGLPPEGNADARSLLESVVARLAADVTLLVLDNCEHLLEAAANLAQQLLSRCPDLRLLSTSRQRLGLTGELAWRVPSLLFPSEPETRRAGSAAGIPLPAPLADYSAVRLFVERATAVRAGFRLAGREEVEAVCRICRRLDGIPLALELAAARAHVLPVGQIASRLDDRFRLLTGGSRAASPRHQTLHALLDWSYDLLAEAEKRLLRRLSVFAGGWAWEAAAQVGASESEGGEGIADWEVLDWLTGLADKSLVSYEETEGRGRYRMLETVREYGREKLRMSGEERGVRERHADHYLGLAEKARPFMTTSDPAWLDLLETEHDNLRAALTFYSGQEETIEKAVRLAAELGVFWNTRGHLHDQRTWLVGLAQRPTARTETRARLLADAGWIAAQDGEFALARQMFTERLAIWRQLGNRWGIADTLIGLAGLLSDRSLAGSEYDPETARTLASESLTIMRELGHRQGMAQGCYVLGRLARQAGDRDTARAYWRECSLLDRELGVKGGHVLPMLGELALETGDPAAAGRDYQTFLLECRQTGNRQGMAWALRGLGAVAEAQAEPERAARLLGASLALQAPFGQSDEERTRYEALECWLREAISPSALEAAQAEGGAMTLEQAVMYALETGPAPSAQ